MSIKSIIDAQVSDRIDRILKMRPIRDMLAGPRPIIQALGLTYHADSPIPVAANSYPAPPTETDQYLSQAQWRVWAARDTKNLVILVHISPDPTVAGARLQVLPWAEHHKKWCATCGAERAPDSAGCSCGGAEYVQNRHGT